MWMKTSMDAVDVVNCTQSLTEYARIDICIMFVLGAYLKDIRFEYVSIANLLLVIGLLLPNI